MELPEERNPYAQPSRRASGEVCIHDDLFSCSEIQIGRTCPVDCKDQGQRVAYIKIAIGVCPSRGTLSPCGAGFNGSGVRSDSSIRISGGYVRSMSRTRSGRVARPADAHQLPAVTGRTTVPAERAVSGPSRLRALVQHAPFVIDQHGLAARRAVAPAQASRIRADHFELRRRIAGGAVRQACRHDVERARPRDTSARSRRAR